MDLYLPIANLSVNALVIVLLGRRGRAAVGDVRGRRRVPDHAVADRLRHPADRRRRLGGEPGDRGERLGRVRAFRRGGVDFKMGGVLVAGGVVGSLVGAWIFRLLQATGQIDTVIAVIYVADARLDRRADGARGVETIWRARRGAAAPRASGGTIRWSPRCRSGRASTRSGLYISPLAPLLLGFSTGILTILLGVGGGFVLVPAMIYLLGMATQVVVGTALFQTCSSPPRRRWSTRPRPRRSISCSPALLLIGSVAGAQVGARFASTVKPEYLRLALAVMVLLVAIRVALGLGWRPDEIYSVELS